MGFADAMWRINLRCGARVVRFIRDAYEDGAEPDECIYYHIDLDSPGHEREMDSGQDDVPNSLLG